jgi:rhodanese-related sulfurtransferase
MNSASSTWGWRRLIRNAILIALAAFAVGLAVNGRLLWKVFTGRALAVSHESASAGGDVPLPLPVELDEVRQLAGDTMLVDARSREAYLEGHLPGALSLPRGAGEERMDAFHRQVPADRPLIVYCSGYGCADSFLLAEQLLASGYRDVRVFEGGVPEWADAGLPLEKGEP